MHKRLLPILTFLFLLLLSPALHAQFRYTFKDTTTPYAALGSGAASLNNGRIWSGENYVAPMPFTWTLDSTIVVNGLPLLSATVLVADTGNPADLNGFTYADIIGPLIDRGNVSGASSLSPIRYTTVGTAPSRIFKLEIANAGFEVELDNYGTLDDSASLQIWIYETSNIVEFHYGPSRITHASDYFLNKSGPFISYLKHVDFDMGTAGEFYYIKRGAGGTTGIDSIDFATLFGSPTPPTNILGAWPASGRVFRFTPKRSAAPCNLPVASFTSGAPSGNTVSYTYTGTVTGIDSLVWNWGDSTKQTITSGFTTPRPHTFARAGRYTVSVTAYNSCGSNRSSSQSSVSVGDLPGLGNVRVYPNPATDQLFIEGLARGGNAVIRSMMGQVLLRAAIGAGQKESLGVAGLPEGVYTLTITDASGATASLRFIRQ